MLRTNTQSRLFSLTAFALVSTLALAGCDDGGSGDGVGGDDGAGGDRSTESGGTGGGAATESAESWLGSEPHVEISGTLAGQVIDFSVAAAEAGDVGTAYCERNYIQPATGDLYLEKIEIKYNLVYDDQFAEFQLEVVHPDLPTVVGETLSIGGDTELNVGLKLSPDEPTEEEFEDLATSGAVTIGEVGGTDDGGLIPDGSGTFGVHFDVMLESGGTLSGSFTVNCGDNDIEIEE